MNKPAIPTSLLIINFLIDMTQYVNLILALLGICWLLFSAYLDLKKRYNNNEVHGKFYDFLFKK